MSPYKNTLEINHRSKGIPYGGTGQVREDGDANYGFKYVKGNDALLLQIPELTRDHDLLELVRAINAPETGLFSVGCVSAPVEDRNGFRKSGYVEFALNSISGIADAQNYFPIFFHFDRTLNERSFKVAVSYFWEIQPGVFFERNAPGFTCSIILNTHYAKTQDEANAAWTDALSVLASFLRGVPGLSTDFIYAQ